MNNKNGLGGKILTNVLLANQFEELGRPRNLGIYFTIVFLIVFLIIFVSNMIYVMKNSKLVVTSDNSEYKKKILKKCMIFLIISFAFLEIGRILALVCFTFATGSIREPNYIDFIFELMRYIVLISVIILGIIIELVSKKKVSNKLVHIVSIIALILVSSLSIILIVGLFRGEYYNTTYRWV